MHEIHELTAAVNSLQDGGKYAIYSLVVIAACQVARLLVAVTQNRQK